LSISPTYIGSTGCHRRFRYRRRCLSWPCAWGANHCPGLLPTAVSPTCSTCYSWPKEKEVRSCRRNSKKNQRAKQCLDLLVGPSIAGGVFLGIKSHAR
jgi:hypothetical protein